MLAHAWFVVGSRAIGTFPDFLDNDATTVARRLLGCVVVRQINGRTIRLRIVETESYDERDAASHSYRGRTPRTDVMFGPSGYLYVYFTYGMHYCCNVVTGKEGEGSAVLIRALEPLDHQEYLEDVRNQTGVNVTNGPAKLCAALGITRAMNGRDLREGDVQLQIGQPIPAKDIVAAPRIGISQNKHALRRFYIRTNAYVSKC